MHRARHFAGLLKAGIFTEASKQLVQTGMERVAVRDLQCPSLIRAWYHPLLDCDRHRLRVCLSHGPSNSLFGNAFEQAASKNCIEFYAVEADWGDIQCPSADFLVGVVDRLLDTQAAFAPSTR